MRRKDREITDFNEQLAIIKKCDVIHIAMNDGDYPYIVPMNFGVDVQKGQVFFYLHCAMKGKKLELLEKDNRVFFEMDCSRNFILYEERMSCTMGYESIMGRGTVSVVPEEDKFAALKILMRQYHAEDFKFNTDMMKVTTVLKLTVSEMTGKRRNNIH